MAQKNKQDIEIKRISQAAGVVGFFTLGSRILGFVRDMVIAYFFGTHVAADAFFVAFRIPNLLRRLLAEGSLTVAFIPIFTDYLKNRTRKEAFAMASVIASLLTKVLFVISVIGVIFAPLIIKLIAPGFTEPASKFYLTVMLLRIMFPYIFFIGLVALCMGILNTLGRFAAPAMAPILLNISMISCLVLLYDVFAEPITALAVGVIAGGALQLLMQIPYLQRVGFTFKWSPDIHHPAVKKLGFLMLPTIFGAAVYQLNILIGTFLASFLPTGAVSYLYYSDRLVQFPLGIFGIALATATLPSFSRFCSNRDMDGLRSTIAHALKLIFFITIPAMVGLIILRTPIIRLLFMRGEFDEKSLIFTSQALFCYTLGLWAFAGVRIIVPVYYSMKDTVTPVKIATISLVVNLILSILLMNPLAHNGLALATSIASMLNFVFLLIFFKGKIKQIPYKNILITLIRIIICSLFMGVVLYGLNMIIPVILNNYTGSLQLLIHVGCGMVFGILSYFIFSWFFGLKDMIRAVVRMVPEKITKKVLRQD